MMRKGRTSILATIMLAFGLCAIATSCDDSESYAELLDSERKAVNDFLSAYRVINGIPADTVFETGEDAPYYRIEEEGNVYMQVIKAGDRDSMAKTGDKIYFRYTRYDLSTLYEEGYVYGSSNSSSMEYASIYFYFNDFTKSASTDCGYGLQLPLVYIGINSEVNLVIKSQYGMNDEISDVTPYNWNVRYFKSAL